MSPRFRHVGAGALRHAPVGLERPPLTRPLWRLRHRSRRGCGIHESVIQTATSHPVLPVQIKELYEFFVATVLEREWSRHGLPKKYTKSLTFGPR